MSELIPEQNPSDALQNILIGATDLRTVAIRYRDKSNELSERIVEPYEMKIGKLFAYCQTKAGIRAFDKPNILVAQVTEDHYEPRYPVKIATINNLL
jgi:predicted DNA-binding transcriptional regulator YafY